MIKDVDLAFHISESPDELATKLVENLLIPILSQKLAYSGEIAAAQLYFNIIYALARSRAAMVGHDAIFEIHGIATELEEHVFGSSMNDESEKSAADESQFIQVTGKPS